jgi:hypothetical protein
LVQFFCLVGEIVYVQQGGVLIHVRWAWLLQKGYFIIVLMMIFDP